MQPICKFLPKLWSVNINGWSLPVGTSNLDHPFSALKNTSMSMAPCRRTISFRQVQSALAWPVKPPSSRAWLTSFWGATSPRLPLPLMPPAPFQEASSLGSLPPCKCFTEHIRCRIRNIFLLIFRHWVQKLFNLLMFPPPLFSIIYTSCLVAEAIVFGS